MGRDCYKFPSRFNFHEERDREHCHLEIGMVRVSKQKAKGYRQEQLYIFHGLNYHLWKLKSPNYNK